MSALLCTGRLNLIAGKSSLSTLLKLFKSIAAHLCTDRLNLLAGDCTLRSSVLYWNFF
jgi:hypothetical protein